MSGRRKWIDLGNGARMREPTKAAAAFHRQQQAENLAMKRRIEADTCGWDAGKARRVGTARHSRTR
jgi:hypothetical protein